MMDSTVVRGPTSEFGNALQYARAHGFHATLHAFSQALSARWQLRKTQHGARIRVRGTVIVRNSGLIELGDRLRFDGRPVPTELTTASGACLSIGEGTYINYGTNIGATREIRIGANCAIGQYCIIMDNDFHTPGKLDVMPGAQPVAIGDGVWLGARVIVLPGTQIGAGSVIGANSVVRGVIPAGVVAAGMPARVLRPVSEVSGNG